MKRLIIGVIVVVVGLLVVYNIIMPLLPGTQEDVLNESRCRSEKRAMEEDITGILIRKFMDKSSHMWETIEYSNPDKSLQSSVIFLNDQSGAYDFIEPGDSIVKELNSLNFKIIRDGNTRVFTLDFDCVRKKDEELK